jgi:predicted ATP-dependent endonuclease of OLD family
MELIYVFMKEVRGELFELEFNFSDDYCVKYNKNTKELNFEKTGRSFPKKFFGENIVNVNAVVGKNGVGKSTLLALLGLQKIDRRHELRPLQWFAIYHLKDDLFAIEGYDESLLKNPPLNNEQDYFFYFKQDEINNNLKYDLDEGKVKEIRSKVIFLYFPDMKTRKPSFGDDSNLSFQREYLNPNNKSVYKYLTDNYKDLDNKINKQQVKLKISSLFSAADVSGYEKIKLYKDIDGFYTKFSIFPTKKTSALDNKQFFIINMLEMLINENMLRSIKNHFPEKIDQPIDKDSLSSFLKHNNSPYKGSLEDYSSIKCFLIDRLKEFVSLADNIHGLSSELNFDDIIKHLETFPEKFFSKNNSESILTIGLEEYNQEFFDLLSDSDARCVAIPFQIVFPQKSDGELAIIRKIAAIHSALEKNIKIGKKNFIIILDEVDQHLHPEWSRCVLSMLLELMHEYINKANIQLLLSTHSPYLISDLPRKNVLKIKKDENEKLDVSPSNYGFGANIYDIINDSFFLNSSIGEFSKRKIEEIVNFLSDDVSIYNGEFMNDKNVIKDIIEIIDEPFIKKNLSLRFYEKFSAYEKINAYEKIKKIKELEKELEYLRRDVKL